LDADEDIDSDLEEARMDQVKKNKPKEAMKRQKYKEG